MKKILFSLAAAVLFFPALLAQSNNPFDALGIQTMKLANAVYEDYYGGKLNEINQETLDHYCKTYLPQYESMKLDDFNTMLGILKGSTNESIIEKSLFSDEGKAFLKKSFQKCSTTKLVEEVKESAIPENEKESILSMLAINYNLVKPFYDQKLSKDSGKGPSSHVYLTDINCSHPFIEADGVQEFLWGGLGFITGNSICGPICGVFGAVAGLIFGSSRNDGNSTIGSTGSSGYNGGWNYGSDEYGPQP